VASSLAAALRRTSIPSARLPSAQIASPLGEELRERRLSLEQHVIAPFERDEAGSRDEPSDHAPLVERNARILPHMEAKVVPAKRFMFPPYSFAANYYFPETKPGAPAAAARK
jgi:hypothetical protein